MSYQLSNQVAVRAHFWAAHIGMYTRKPGMTHNQYPTDVRCAFVDHVDALQKAGLISEALAQRVTLG